VFVFIPVHALQSTAQSPSHARRLCDAFSVPRIPHDPYLALFLAGLAAFEYGLYELMNIGTCASGGPYEIARPCPEGTFEKALLLPGGLILGGVGIVVFALRGRRPGAPEGGWRASPWLVGWAPFFIATGAVALIAGLGSDGADAGAAKWTGIFLAAMFIPMGLVPVLWALTGGSSGRHRRAGAFNPITNQVLRNAERTTAAARPQAGPAPPVAPSRPASPVASTPVGGDPVERLRKLGELRDAGVLSPSEFEAAKSRILAEL
jgi:hypothetical protein